MFRRRNITFLIALDRAIVLDYSNHMAQDFDHSTQNPEPKFEPTVWTENQLRVELQEAFDRAEQVTANHFAGSICSMQTVDGDHECPICYFRSWVKIFLGLNTQPTDEGQHETA